MDEAKLDIQEVAHHRNGVAGECFYLVRFQNDGANMLATYFPEYDRDGNLGVQGSMTIAVICLDSLPAIEFGENSYRGDHFARQIAEAVIEYEAGADDRLAALAAEYRANAEARQEG